MIKTPLWKHQVEAVQFAKQRAACFLNMEMRTGKTLASLALIDQEKYWYTLIVAPKKALGVWEYEIETHTDGFSIFNFDYTGTVVTKTRDLKKFLTAKSSKPVIILVNYDVIHKKQLFDLLFDRHWDIMILDEGHRIKAHNSKQSKAAWKLGKKASKRVILTGTIFPNSPSDAFGQVRFLDDKLFDEPGNKVTTVWYRFRDKFETSKRIPGVAVPITTGYKNQDLMAAKMAPITFTIKQSEVFDMPDELDVLQFVRMPAIAQKRYDQFENEFITDLELGEITASNVLVRSLRLRQMAGGFAAPDYGKVEEVHREKLLLLEELIEEAGSERIVVFSQFTAEIEAIHQLLTRNKLTNIRIDGKINEYSKWKDAQIAVVQLQAGAEAISLKGASIMAFYSLPFSYGQYQQARARIKAPGSGTLTYYHLLCKDTIDEVMYAMLQEKGATIEDLLKHMKERRK